MTGSVIAQIWPLFIVALFVVIVRWHRRRVPDWGDVPNGVVLERESDGAMIVPVSQLIHRRLWGHTTNGISPKLWLTHSGLRFKVFKPNERSFADFKRVEAYKSLFHGTQVTFAGRGEQLHVMIRDRGVARAVLRMLPSNLPLTPAAAALRGDRPTPGTT
ncbi:hypothetical protein [Peristeroidobacter soli]|uniref:hypothetical protein n=1 Tax=Peristeroidobacter soli TaxID=2497877 RepID=UPI00101DD9FB|nr:hypothetical protein [Peristeroidobacter soli]